MTTLCRGSLDDVIKTRFKIVESVKPHLRKAMVYNVKEGYFRHTRCWRASRYHSEMEWRAFPLVASLPGPYAWITLVASPLCIFQTFHCLRVNLPFVNYWINPSSTCNYITFILCNAAAEYSFSFPKVSEVSITHNGVLDGGKERRSTIIPPRFHVRLISPRFKQFSSSYSISSAYHLFTRNFFIAFIDQCFVENSSDNSKCDTAKKVFIVIKVDAYRIVFHICIFLEWNGMTGDSWHVPSYPCSRE